MVLKIFCEDNLQMKVVERLYCIVKTEIHGDRNHAKSLFYEEIRYTLTIWKNYSESLIRELCQPAISWVNTEENCRVKEVEEIPLVFVSVVSGFVRRNEQLFSDVMKKGQDMEVYVVLDVI